MFSGVAEDGYEEVDERFALITYNAFGGGKRIQSDIAALNTASMSVCVTPADIDISMSFIRVQIVGVE